MEDKEKQAIEYMDKIVSDCENHWKQLGYTCKLYDGDEPIPVDMYKTVLNLIEKQQTEINASQMEHNHDVKMIDEVKGEAVRLYNEIDRYKKMLAEYTAHTVCSDWKQMNKHNEDLEMLYKGCQIELEEKDKRISNLEFALMDMVLQFADENKDSINTMGLSALEIAFSELEFDNPMSIKEVHKRYKELAQKYYQ